MFPKTNPTTTGAWTALQEHYNHEMKQTRLRELFAADASRFKKYSIQYQDILFDYSKNIITDKTLLYCFSNWQHSANCPKPSTPCLPGKK